MSQTQRAETVKGENVSKSDEKEIVETSEDEIVPRNEMLMQENEDCCLKNILMSHVDFLDSGKTGNVECWEIWGLGEEGRGDNSGRSRGSVERRGRDGEDRMVGWGGNVEIWE